LSRSIKIKLDRKGVGEVKRSLLDGLSTETERIKQERLTTTRITGFQIDDDETPTAPALTVEKGGVKTIHALFANADRKVDMLRWGFGPRNAANIPTKDIRESSIQVNTTAKDPGQYIVTCTALKVEGDKSIPLIDASGNIIQNRALVVILPERGETVITNIRVENAHDNSDPTNPIALAGTDVTFKVDIADERGLTKKFKWIFHNRDRRSGPPVPPVLRETNTPGIIVGVDNLNALNVLVEVFLIDEGGQEIRNQSGIVKASINLRILETTITLSEISFIPKGKPPVIRDRGQMTLEKGTEGTINLEVTNPENEELWYQINFLVNGKEEEEEKSNFVERNKIKVPWIASSPAEEVDIVCKVLKLEGDNFKQVTVLGQPLTSQVKVILTEQKPKLGRIRVNGEDNHNEVTVEKESIVTLEVESNQEFSKINGYSWRALNLKTSDEIREIAQTRNPFFKGRIGVDKDRFRLICVALQTITKESKHKAADLLRVDQNIEDPAVREEFAQRAGDREATTTSKESNPILVDGNPIVSTIIINQVHTESLQETRLQKQGKLIIANVLDDDEDSAKVIYDTGEITAIFEDQDQIWGYKWEVEKIEETHLQKEQERDTRENKFIGIKRERGEYVVSCIPIKIKEGKKVLEQNQKTRRKILFYPTAKTDINIAQLKAEETLSQSTKEDAYILREAGADTAVEAIVEGNTNENVAHFWEVRKENGEILFTDVTHDNYILLEHDQVPDNFSIQCTLSIRKKQEILPLTNRRKLCKASLKLHFIDKPETESVESGLNLKFGERTIKVTFTGDQGIDDLARQAIENIVRSQSIGDLLAQHKDLDEIIIEIEE